MAEETDTEKQLQTLFNKTEIISNDEVNKLIELLVTKNILTNDDKLQKVKEEFLSPGNYNFLDVFDAICRVYRLEIPVIQSFQQFLSNLGMNSNLNDIPAWNAWNLCINNPDFFPDESLRHLLNGELNLKLLDEKSFSFGNYSGFEARILEKAKTMQNPQKFLNDFLSKNKNYSNLKFPQKEKYLKENIDIDSMINFTSDQAKKMKSTAEQKYNNAFENCWKASFEFKSGEIWTAYYSKNKICIFDSFNSLVETIDQVTIEQHHDFSEFPIVSCFVGLTRLTMPLCIDELPSLINQRWRRLPINSLIGRIKEVGEIPNGSVSNKVWSANSLVLKSAYTVAEVRWLLSRISLNIKNLETVDFTDLKKWDPFRLHFVEPLAKLVLNNIRYIDINTIDITKVHIIGKKSTFIRSSSNNIHNCTVLGDLTEIETNNVCTQIPKNAFGDLEKTVWRLNKGADVYCNRVRVAILDCGANILHPDIRPNVAEFQSFIGTKGWIAPENNHGTFCASIITAIAPECSLYVGEVVDSEGFGSLEALVKGIHWAIKRGCEVISLSLGSRSSDPSLLEAINLAQSKSIHIICAAANGGVKSSTNILYPARFGHVICVGAADENGHAAGFSSKGREVDFLAPGTFINAAFSKLDLYGHRHSYKTYSGTSVAVPFVSGLVAILVGFFSRLARPLRCSELKEILLDFCTHNGYHSQEDGYGVLYLTQRNTRKSFLLDSVRDLMTLQQETQILKQTVKNLTESVKNTPDTKTITKNLKKSWKIIKNGTENDLNLLIDVLRNKSETLGLQLSTIAQDVEQLLANARDDVVGKTAECIYNNDWWEKVPKQDDAPILICLIPIEYTNDTQKLVTNITSIVNNCIQSLGNTNSTLVVSIGANSSEYSSCNLNGEDQNKLDQLLGAIVHVSFCYWQKEVSNPNIRVNEQNEFVNIKYGMFRNAAFRALHDGIEKLETGNIFLYHTDSDCTLNNALQKCLAHMNDNPNTHVWCGGYITDENRPDKVLLNREANQVSLKDLLLRVMVFREYSYFCEQNTAIRLSSIDFNKLKVLTYGSKRREMSKFLKSSNISREHWIFEPYPVTTRNERPSRKNPDASLAHDQTHMKQSVIFDCLQNMFKNEKKKDEINDIATALCLKFTQPDLALTDPNLIIFNQRITPTVCELLSAEELTLEKIQTCYLDKGNIHVLQNSPNNSNNILDSN